jgi:hypothetical protein
VVKLVFLSLIFTLFTACVPRNEVVSKSTPHNEDCRPFWYNYKDKCGDEIHCLMVYCIEHDTMRAAGITAVSCESWGGQSKCL